MKKTKNNLDEMQEQKLLKIEHNGMWLAFCALLAAIIIQAFIGEANFGEKTIGENIILLILSLYISISCAKNGIWDRKLKPTALTNFLVSCAAGIFTGLMCSAVTYKAFHILNTSIIVFTVAFVIMLGICFIALTVSAAAYKKKRKELDEVIDETDN